VAASAIQACTGTSMQPVWTIRSKAISRPIICMFLDYLLVSLLYQFDKQPLHKLTVWSHKACNQYRNTMTLTHLLLFSNLQLPVSQSCLSRRLFSFSRGLPRDVVSRGWPIAPSLMSPNACGWGGCGVSANEYSYAHRAQINFGDLTPYLT
jgi:hypothetical protein